MMNSIPKIFVLCLSVLLPLPQSVAAHPGGLDAKGCHNVRATGEYHCHRSTTPQQQDQPAAPAWIPVQVLSVVDGDTVRAVVQGHRVKVRLYGIDAPEKNQPGGSESTEALRRLLNGHRITMQALARDRYGRTVALLSADGVSVNEAMIRNGHAWTYSKYCTQDFCTAWRQEEAAALGNRRGIWSQSAAIPPWKWRRSSKSGGPHLIR